MPVRRPFDPRHGLRGFLILDGVVRLLLWVAAMSGALATVAWLEGWPSHSLRDADFPGSWAWADKFAWLIFFFNVYYVLAMVVLRLPIPRPAEGTYRLEPGRAPDRNLIWSMLIATLTKARYEAPFPGFLVHHVSNLPPLSWLVTAVIGPKSRSVGVTDARIIDPYGIEIGRNVVIGLGAIISAHTQGRDDITIGRTVIGDDVLIGGNVSIYHGVRIGRGAVILGGAVVRPNTVIGKNEVWGGIPARRIKTLPEYGSAEGRETEAGWRDGDDRAG